VNTRFAPRRSRKIYRFKGQNGRSTNDPNLTMHHLDSGSATLDILHNLRIDSSLGPLFIVFWQRRSAPLLNKGDNLIGPLVPVSKL
jgi:hypothetical protein